MLGDYDIPESKRPRMLSLEIPAAYFDPGVRYDFSVVPHGFFGTEGEWEEYWRKRMDLNQSVMLSFKVLKVR